MPVRYSDEFLISICANTTKSEFPTGVKNFLRSSSANMVCGISINKANNNKEKTMIFINGLEDSSR